MQLFSRLSTPAYKSKTMTETAILGHGIVELKSHRPGPRIGIICNIHGNESCGKLALNEFLSCHELLSGSLVIIDGNPEAALLNRRYVQSDMNRMFSAKNLSISNPTGDLKRAQYLAQIIPKLNLNYAIDIHTTSGETSLPFTVSFPGSENITRICPIPKIYGWKGIIEGTFVEWMNTQGIQTLGIEAGQHIAKNSIDVAVGVLKAILNEYGLFKIQPDATGTAHQRGMNEQSFEVIENVEIQHPTSFTYKDSFTGFDELRAGQVIATDNYTQYTAPNEEGFHILMPALKSNIISGLSKSAYYLMRKYSETTDHS